MDQLPTLIACLTPPGRGAIATLAVRGPRAWEITRTLFQPAPPRRTRGATAAHATTLPDAAPVGRFWFGQLGAELRDEVILAVKGGGEFPSVEVQCHGGPEVVRLLLEAFVQQGATSCSWEALEQLAPAPRWRQEIRSCLVQAPTVRTASILLTQYVGAFAAAVREMVAALDQDESARATSLLTRLARHAALGRHLVRPWRLVIAGAPNVGKSSLVNALAGYTRSLVSPIPGTTRDLVDTTLAIDGWPVEVTDTAGVRLTEQPLENAGIARARQASRQADLRLWVLDGSAPPVLPEEVDLPWLFALNKVDLPSAWDWSSHPGALRVSAVTRAGLAELCAAISTSLVPILPDPAEAVPCQPAHVESIEQALARLEAGEPPAARAILAALLE